MLNRTSHSDSLTIYHVWSRSVHILPVIHVLAQELYAAQEGIKHLWADLSESTDLTRSMVRGGNASACDRLGTWWDSLSLIVGGWLPWLLEHQMVQLNNS